MMQSRKRSLLLLPLVPGFLFLTVGCPSPTANTNATAGAGRSEPTDTAPVSAASPSPNATDKEEKAAGGGAPAANAAAPNLVFERLCDGSAGVVVGGTLLAVASDERTKTEGDNQIVLYSQSGGKPVLKPLSLNAALGLPFEPNKDGDDSEADIEAAAPIDNIVYWITSHGQSKKGKDRAAKQRFFATTFTGQGKDTKAAIFGTPYAKLRQDMLADKAALGPQMAAMLESASHKGPEDTGGWNIEGMTATDDKKTLLIAFRNPNQDGKAILVPFLNPKAVVETGAKAEFGKPILLDVNAGIAKKDRGIRDIAYWPAKNCYLVLAGSFLSGDNPDAAPFALFRWSGKEADALTPLPVDLSGLNPEGVVPLSGDSYLILSDDGTRDACKDKADAEKQFRGRSFILK